MVDKQVLNKFLNKRKNPGKKNSNHFPNIDEMAIGERRTLKAAILVLDIANSSKLEENEFIRYVSPFLHMVFHIVNEKKGIVDKYTGDGAMISFCDKNQPDELACENALNAALEMSQLLIVLKKEHKFPDLKIRIGIDFGLIKVEKIGLKTKPQLIIVGRPAITAKRLESIGKKHATFDQNSTICIGSDIFHLLSAKRKNNSKIIIPPFPYCNYLKGVKSHFGQKSPYKIYEFQGRYR
ncbi:hypothetical protein NEF87_004850 [Candidatus Lokiarchaeum ossiferum]|uniref:Guanylate cyclase domain-containing protein n=1 Tax=Candidatus Lokiarchaeum ossiferum TaxID=2951803 RepID=A0ABY6HYF1_9ARCH|nr:hypothetical protein NEF87_004850 [Candidatus Lokiarchaeum sp. B-35]